MTARLGFDNHAAESCQPRRTFVNCAVSQLGWWMRIKLRW